MHRTIIAASAVFAAASAATAADTAFQGGSFATFSDPSPAGTNNSIVNAAARGGVSTFESGDPAFIGGEPNPNGDPNTLKFFGVDTFNTNLAMGALQSDPFIIGSVSYFNGIVSTGTAADFLVGTVNVEFDLPAGLGDQAFTFDFTILNTDNGGVNPGEPDILTIVPPADPVVFQFMGMILTLNIEGFDIRNIPVDPGDADFNPDLPFVGDGIIDDTAFNGLAIAEEDTSYADIIATITPVIPLPGPAALGLAGIAAVSARRNRA